MRLTTDSPAIQLAPAKYRAPLIDTLETFNIINVPEFLGTVYYESSYLTNLVESLNYTSDALLKKFSRKRISYNDAMRLGRAAGRPANQEAIANKIYGGAWGEENLGNTLEGDGWYYRGQGPIQLTGKDNWRKFSKFLKRQDIGDNPFIILTSPTLACYSAGWFWTEFKRLNSLGSDMRAITKKVTGAPDTAIKTRTAYRDRIRDLLSREAQ